MSADMVKLVHARCFNHAQREAVAACPQCGRFFCRECITEHETRIVCAQCLKKASAIRAQRGSHHETAARAVLLAAGLVICWFFFYAMGRILIQLPDSFHEGTLWKTGRVLGR